MPNVAPLVVVKRVAKLLEGCFGVMLHSGAPFAVTLEHSYEDNEPKIAAGVYLCKASRYFKGGYDTFEIIVPGHTRILYHKANLERDLDGCVGIGESFSLLEGSLSIAQSGDGFAEFMRRVGHLDSFYVEFIDC